MAPYGGSGRATAAGNHRGDGRNPCGQAPMMHGGGRRPRASEEQPCAQGSVDQPPLRRARARIEAEAPPMLEIRMETPDSAVVVMRLDGELDTTSVPMFVTRARQQLGRA